ncbi:MAG: NAD-dependent epimerase/dehydratase family protein [Deltaproteobacteria bacterium]|nr:NAD-dependent epimerase/dehydratase family protein [Deltaproteobacteria bacterium]
MKRSFFKGRKALITGGAGFVGSNLARALVEAGADVTVIDNFHPDYGANVFNFTGIANKLRLVRGDITDRGLVAKLCAGAETVFHAAAQCSHVDSMIDPWLDLDYNCRGTLSVLEGARASPLKPSVAYAGTRAIVGAPLEMPATESTLPNPVDVYGVNKHAAELYGAVYARAYRVPFVSLRLTNSFGPYHQMKSGKYGILNWFLGQALQGKPIRVFGTGEQLRDYLYIDDAVDAFLRAGEFVAALATSPRAYPRARLAGEKIPYAVFNVGSGQGMKFADCARRIVECVGSKLEFVPWPPERAAIETGDFIADSALAGEILGWKPETAFEEGLKRTVAFYRENLRHYL